MSTETFETEISLTCVEGLTEGQVRWAMQHDWFLRTCRMQPRTNETGFIIGVVVRHDLEEGEMLHFSDFQELKAWAGY